VKNSYCEAFWLQITPVAGHEKNVLQHDRMFVSSAGTVHNVPIRRHRCCKWECSCPVTEPVQPPDFSPFRATESHAQSRQNFYCTWFLYLLCLVAALDPSCLCLFSYTDHSRGRVKAMLLYSSFSGGGLPREDNSSNVAPSFATHSFSWFLVKSTAFPGV